MTDQTPNRSLQHLDRPAHLYVWAPVWLGCGFFIAIVPAYFLLEQATSIVSVAVTIATIEGAYIVRFGATDRNAPCSG